MADRKNSSDIETGTGNLMRALLHAYYWFDESRQNCMQARGIPLLPRAQTMVIVNVIDGVTRPSELADHLGVSRQAIHQTLAEMEAQELIRLLPDPDDKRAKIVCFSKHGRRSRDAALDVFTEVEAELEKRLGKRLMQHFKKVLYSNWGPIASFNDNN